MKENEKDSGARSESPRSHKNRWSVEEWLSDKSEQFSFDCPNGNKTWQGKDSDRHVIFFGHEDLAGW